jgi:hypothetical protein
MGLGPHSLRHEPLEVGIDRAVLGRNRIEARFRSPRGLRGLAGEQSLLERLLDRIEHLCLCRGQIAREIPQEGLLVRRPSSPSKTMPAVALSPPACNRAITSDQHDPSANRPRTSTTLPALGSRPRPTSDCVLPSMGAKHGGGPAFGLCRTLMPTSAAYCRFSDKRVFDQNNR